VTLPIKCRVAFHEAGHCAAAILFRIPVTRVTIENGGCLYRGHYSGPAGIGLERIVMMCLSGPAAEEFFCGPIEDGADRVDYAMARRYLARRFHALHIGAEIVRLRDAAERLVRTDWAQRRIWLIAVALLRHGTLTGDEIGVMIAADAYCCEIPPPWSVDDRAHRRRP
jgi:hypothetical protein